MEAALLKRVINHKYDTSVYNLSIITKRQAGGGPVKKGKTIITKRI
jgi:hypothetical protein